MTALETKRRRPVTARQAAEKLGVSPSTIRRIVAQPRAEWIADQAERREEIRAYHDEGGHSWSETAKHFGLSHTTVKERGYRARKERAAEAEESAKGDPLPFDEAE